MQAADASLFTCNQADTLVLTVSDFFRQPFDAVFHNGMLTDQLTLAGKTKAEIGIAAQLLPDRQAHQLATGEVFEKRQHRDDARIAGRRFRQRADAFDEGLMLLQDADRVGFLLTLLHLTGDGLHILGIVPE